MDRVDVIVRETCRLPPPYTARFALIPPRTVLWPPKPNACLLSARLFQGPDEDAEQAAGLMKAEDEEWEARIGLSAESSVAVGSGGDDDALDSEAYDEIEDAQSI